MRKGIDLEEGDDPKFKFYYDQLVPLIVQSTNNLLAGNTAFPTQMPQ